MRISTFGLEPADMFSSGGVTLSESFLTHIPNLKSIIYIESTQSSTLKFQMALQSESQTVFIKNISTVPIVITIDDHDFTLIIGNDTNTLTIEPGKIGEINRMFVTENVNHVRML